MAYLFDKNGYRLLDAAGFVLKDAEGLTLIIDRTAADVELVKRLAKKGFSNMTEAEKEEWLSGLKGAYNASDMNRVENAVLYVSDRLKIAGIHITLDTKTDWEFSDFVTPDEAQRYLANVRAIRACLPAGIRDLDFDDMDRFTYEEANQIEQILAAVDAAITNIMQNVFYSGEIFAGEVY